MKFFIIDCYQFSIVLTTIFFHSILNKNNIPKTKMLSKQLLLILAVIFTITVNNADAKKCKDKKKNKEFKIEEKLDTRKQTCSEWIGEEGLLCKNSKKVKKNCKLSCGKCTASPTESPTDATCEDKEGNKEGKFKV